jgi:hypothetical protein
MILFRARLDYLFRSAKLHTVRALMGVVLLGATVAALSTVLRILALIFAALSSPEGIAPALGNTVIELIPVPLYISLIWLCWCGLIENKKEVKALQQEPPITINDLPVTQVLVRGSAEPASIQQGALLRPAQNRIYQDEIDKSELLRTQNM